MWDASRMYSCVACLLFVFSTGRLAVPLQDMDFERHATLLFCAKSVNVQTTGAKHKRSTVDEKQTGIDAIG